MSKLKVVSLSVSPSRLTFYIDTGEVINAPMVSEDISEFVSHSLEAIRKEGFFLISKEDLVFNKKEKDNTPLIDSIKSSGLVGFFISSKKRIKQFLKGKSPEDFNETTLDLESIIKRSKRIKTVGDITSTKETDSTVVALVEDKEGNKTIVSDLELIDGYFQNAIKIGNQEGLVKFIERLAAVQNERNFPTKDLLTFLSNNNMPISNRGDIIGFKGLVSKGDGVYVDSYSKKVKQGLLTRVFMDKSLVDDSRSVDCSYGLHVASIGYLSNSFMNTTDTLFLSIIKPEDVIAVPAYDPTKIRVTEYLNASLLTAEEFNSVKEGRESILNNPSLLKKLNHLINHLPEPVNGTEITDHMGKGLIMHEYTSTVKNTSPKTTKVKSVDLVEKLVKPTKEDVSKKSKENLNNIIKKESNRMTNRERMKLLVEEYNKGGSRVSTANEIMTLKRSAKQSWEYFNVSKKDAYSIETTFKNT